MHKMYIKFDKGGKFDGFGIQVLTKGFETKLPDNAFVITDEQHQEYLAALNGHIKDVVLVKNKIKIVDKFTDDELAQQQSDREQAQLIAQAKALLAQNEYRWNSIKMERYTPERKQQILDYYYALVAVVNKESTTLPTLEN